ncbi:Ribonuclease domain-containing protein [Rhizoctonia solani]|uniref:Ribonuclease domain-containing protein n=1 Tax=Rhizoctonia solani TaxID=456999 RepID=A0A8H7IE15_9AGAM|nr:Ribonuclease domain-containing protein [Rhizoctonia solani]KAF8685570.1 hypothetical protein RHS04_00499 [Rhizoctonia solani]KAF8755066.1 hypothetical protein RHS01_05488 [Rhizoctonia solani]QRW20406.1 Ribonuclease domain-containing protein [Rhizoctonia solani]
MINADPEVVVNPNRAEYATANAGRFDFGKPYTIKLDNESEWEFTREQVLTVLEHAVRAGDADGVESIHDAEGGGHVKYPHRFYNKEELDFASYNGGDLYEYPILLTLLDNGKPRTCYFGPKPHSRDPYKYRVVYTKNGAGVGILQGKSKSGKEIPWQKGQEQKKSSDFVISPQFRKGWDSHTGKVAPATKNLGTGKATNATWKDLEDKQNNAGK